jgi:hypothetical protein
MAKFIVKINKDGSFIIEGEGFKSTGCRNSLSTALEALGRTTSSEDKPEMFEAGDGQTLTND